MPRLSHASFVRVSAALLLAVLVLSVAHAAVPDHKTLDCSTCKALHVPGVVAETGGQAIALPPGPGGPSLQEEFRPQLRVRGLQLLRAPPSFS